MNPPPTLKMRSLRQPDRAEPKATFLRCLRARSFFLVASQRLSPRLRVPASKSHSRVSHPIPPRTRPFPRIPGTPDPRHAFSPATRPRRTEGDIPPLSPRSFFLSRCFSAPISASPRPRVKITLSCFPPHSTTDSPVPSNPRYSRPSPCVLSCNPTAPNRRRHSSAVSALVLSFSLLLCAYLRVSASPRQNHTLAFPHSTTGSSVPSNPSYSPSTTCRSRLS